MHILKLYMDYNYEQCQSKSLVIMPIHKINLICKRVFHFISFLTIFQHISQNISL